MSEENIEKLVEGVRKKFQSHEISAAIHIGPFAELLKDNPNKAIGMIFDVYNNTLNEAYTDENGKNLRGFVEAMCGGPLETVPWKLYNAVGEIYPYLEREQKDKALRQILNILDKRNYLEVNGDRGYGHTPGIREPLLLADIFIARPLYWPGLHDEGHLWKGKDFDEIRRDVIDENGKFVKNKVKSDFLLAFALLRNDVGNFEKDYIGCANPSFLEEVMKGISWIEFAPFKKDHLEKEVYDKYVEGQYEKVVRVHSESFGRKLYKTKDESGWVDFTKFRSY